MLCYQQKIDLQILFLNSNLKKRIVYEEMSLTIRYIGKEILV